MYSEDPHPTERIVKEAIREGRAEWFEAVWQVEASPYLTNALARIDMVAFIESQTGRPLPLDPDGYGREQAL